MTPEWRKRGAELYLEGWAPWLLMSGGFGYYTRTAFPEPEACLFAKIAAGLGVPADRVLVESESSNSGDNVAFTKRLLERRADSGPSWLSNPEPLVGSPSKAVRERR